MGEQERGSRVPGRVGRGLDRLRGARPEDAGDSGDSGADESLLLASPLFDEEWYAAQAGRQPDRTAAVRHYLRQGRARGLSPHPLFDPAFHTSRLPRVTRDLDERQGGDVLCAYLRERRFETPTHPLLDTAAYLADVPAARTHPLGPLGHYVESGAAQGLAPNDWLPPAADGSRDLRAWLGERYDEWRARRRAAPRAWVPQAPVRRDAEVRAARAGVPAPRASGEGPVVSVVVRSGTDPDHLATTLRTLGAQTLTDWEALVVAAAGIDDLTGLLARELPGRAVLVLTPDGAPLGQRLDDALELARGDHVAFLEPGDRWDPDRLRLLVLAAEDRGLEDAQEDSPGAVADVLEGTAQDGSTRYAVHGHPVGEVRTRVAVDPARLLVRREVLSGLGRSDPSLAGGWAFDLVARLARDTGIAVVPVVGVRRDFAAHTAALRTPPAHRPAIDHAGVDSWADVVLNRALVDWGDLAARTRRDDTVSVVVPTYDDWELTLEAVRSVAASDGVGGIHVECLVWDNGSTAAVAAVLDSLPVRFPGVRVLHSAVNHGFALGNNLALPHAGGETVMFLNNDTTVPADWLVPVAEALQDPAVLGAQPLLVYPTGAVQSAGVAFPSTGGLPHAFLQGFPVEDAAGAERLELAALTGAALALRLADVVRLQGFDPLFTNGMEDVDLCRRLATLREGHFRVLPAAPVVHHESRTPGRYDRYAANRALYLERWQGRAEPRDDVRLWASRGFRVVDHQVDLPTGRRAQGLERRLAVPMPVLVRESRLRVAEPAPRLRWALKNPAPPGGERWGDTHFARALATALRAQGQEVVIDHRPEFERATGRHDDVALVLRGLIPYRPSPENVSLCWVISHPELLGPAEAASYDRVLAASVPWAARVSRSWGFDVEPLLQATDPALFHPDLAEPDTGEAVLFVGSSRGELRPVVREALAAGLPLAVHGSRWEGFLPAGVLRSTFVDNAELGAAYRAAGVVLNDHWEDMRVEGFLSNRLFDAVAAGARVVTDDLAGPGDGPGGQLGDLFGTSVQVWRSAADLARIAAHADTLFGDDAARRATAERVGREHSFAARAARLVEVAVAERRRRGFGVAPTL